MSIVTSLSPRELVELTVIGEARGEPPEGQIAVANVIKNRFKSNSALYPSYSFVCLQNKQFSCWNHGDSNYAYLLDLALKMLNGQGVEDPFLRQVIYLADGVMDDKIRDNTKGALHYLALNIKQEPSWAKKKITERIIGNQIFFNV